MQNNELHFNVKNWFYKIHFIVWCKIASQVEAIGMAPFARKSAARRTHNRFGAADEMAIQIEISNLEMSLKRRKHSSLWISSKGMAEHAQYNSGLS